MGVDAAVTGNPLYSLHATSELAQELGRTRDREHPRLARDATPCGSTSCPSSRARSPASSSRSWLVPRRALIPLVVLVAQLFVFLAEGAVGVSVIDRYLLGAAAVMVVFCAVALGGWSMLATGLARRVWAGAAAALVAVRRRDRRHDLQPLEPAHHAGLPRGLPPRPRGGSAQLEGGERN